MINLKNYIIEGIFDTNENTIDKNIKDQIKQFLKENFKGASSYKISHKPNKDGKFEVSSNGDVEVKNKLITSLTDGLFIWTNVGRDFNCKGCSSLTSLEGSPNRVDRNFNCSWCESLKSLEGAPKEVGGYFNCEYCTSLTSLKGAPKEVGGNFDCEYCTSLTYLEGSPEEIGGGFYCAKCEHYFTREDVKKVSNVKGTIEI